MDVFFTIFSCSHSTLLLSLSSSRLIRNFFFSLPPSLTPLVAITQLPPVIKNMAFKKFSNMEQSMFTRFVRLGVPVVQLDAQGRARPSIAALYAWRYANLGNLPHTLRLPEFKTANVGFRFDYQLIDVGDLNGRGETTPEPYFYQNLGEAEYVVATYMYMRLLGYPASRITILTTYNGQKALIQDVVNARCASHPLFGMPSKVETVDKFQGSQNDYILLSLVRTTAVGHLRDVRRLVVALSRARLGLYVFCRCEKGGSDAMMMAENRVKNKKKKKKKENKKKKEKNKNKNKNKKEKNKNKNKKEKNKNKKNQLGFFCEGAGGIKKPKYYTRVSRSWAILLLRWFYYFSLSAPPNRKSIFVGCYELGPAFKQLLQRPTELQLYPHESFPTSRDVDDTSAPAMVIDCLQTMANFVFKRACSVVEQMSAAATPAVPTATKMDEGDDDAAEHGTIDAAPGDDADVSTTAPIEKAQGLETMAVDYSSAIQGASGEASVTSEAFHAKEQTLPHPTEPPAPSVDSTVAPAVEIEATSAPPVVVAQDSATVMDVDEPAKELGADEHTPAKRSRKGGKNKTESEGTSSAAAATPSAPTPSTPVVPTTSETASALGTPGLTRSSIQKWTVPKLKEELSLRGLDTSGLKKDLMDRLGQALDQ